MQSRNSSLFFPLSGAALTLVLTGAPVFSGDLVVPASLVLTSIENSTQAQTEFECAGRIHGYVRLPRSQTGPHQLESRWDDPSGKLAAQSQTSITFETPHSTAYVWMDFPERRIGLPGAIDPAMDQTRLSYKGSWRVRVFWDNQPLLEQRFQVRCP